MVLTRRGLLWPPFPPHPIQVESGQPDCSKITATRCCPPRFYSEPPPPSVAAQEQGGAWPDVCGASAQGEDGCLEQPPGPGLVPAFSTASNLPREEQSLAPRFWGQQNLNRNSNPPEDALTLFNSRRGRGTPLRPPAARPHWRRAGDEHLCSKHTAEGGAGVQKGRDHRDNPARAMCQKRFLYRSRFGLVNPQNESF